MILYFTIYMKTIFAVQCPDNETGAIVCEGGGSLCAAATICNNTLRAYFEPEDNSDETNKDIFEFAVENYPNDIVSGSCKWRLGIVTLSGVKYCGGS